MNKQTEILLSAVVGAIVGAALAWFLQPLTAALKPTEVPLVGAVWRHTGDVEDANPEGLGRSHDVRIKTGFPVSGTRLVLMVSDAPPPGSTAELDQTYPQKDLTEFLGDWSTTAVTLGGRRADADEGSPFLVRVCRVQGEALSLVSGYFELVETDLPKRDDPRYAKDQRVIGLDLSKNPDEVSCAGGSVVIVRHN